MGNWPKPTHSALRERRALTAAGFKEGFGAALATPWADDVKKSEALRGPLLRLAASYLMTRDEKQAAALSIRSPISTSATARVSNGSTGWPMPLIRDWPSPSA